MPFFMPYRYSLGRPHCHTRSFMDSGQFSSIYCNILRLIPDQLLIHHVERAKIPIKNLLELLIPHRLFGNLMFSIDDLFDSVGFRISSETLHDSFQTGTRIYNESQIFVHSGVIFPILFAGLISFLCEPGQTHTNRNLGTNSDLLKNHGRHQMMSKAICPTKRRKRTVTAIKIH